MRFDVDNTHRVVFSILADVEQTDVCEVFRRGLHGHARRGVKGWIRHQGHIDSPFARIMAAILPGDFQLRRGGDEGDNQAAKPKSAKLWETPE
jgi:hypothetical protein